MRYLNHWKIVSYRLVCVAALGAMLALNGCGGGAQIPNAGGGMYDRSELTRFDRETGLDPTPVEYIINIGDLLDIVFLYHSNLSTRDLMVRSDGRISLPYVGDQMALGYRPMELDSVLTVKFAEILRDPTLSVIVRRSRESRVYVLGEVKSPGGFSFDHSLSVIQAIAEAGGLIKGAKPEHTIVIRRQSREKIVGVEIDAKSAMKGGMIQNDILLQDMDIVFIPRSRIQGVLEFSETIARIVQAPLDIYFSYWQILNVRETVEFFEKRNAE